MTITFTITKPVFNIFCGIEYSNVRQTDDIFNIYTYSYAYIYEFENSYRFTANKRFQNTQHEQHGYGINH